eukprot:m51a1_g6518 putative adenylate kinase 8 (428) ;mRNA; f:273334-275070
MMQGPESEEACAYAEEHDLPSLFRSALEHLLLRKPEDPVTFLVNALAAPSVPKFAIVGPPGSGKADLISRKFGVTGSRLGRQIAGALSAGLVVPDDLVAEAVASVGVMPSKFVVLELNDDECKRRIRGRRVDGKTGALYHTASMPPDQEVLDRLIQLPGDEEREVERRVEAYHRNIAGVSVAFRPIARCFDASRPVHEVFAEVCGYLCEAEPPGTSIVRTPPRVVIVAPPGAGGKSFARRLAEHLGAVPLSMVDLLKESIEAHTATSVVIWDHMRTFTLVPDEILLSILFTKLKTLQCRHCGYVLVKYPRTRRQAQQLFLAAGCAPNRVVVVDVPEELSQQRLLSRRHDSETGAKHNLLEGPSPDPEVLARLVAKDEDKPACVSRRLGTYRACLQDIAPEFEGIAQHVDGSRSFDSVYADIVRLIGL